VGNVAHGHLSGGELNVTKKEIVKAISEEIGMTQLKTKEIVQKTFNAIVETLVKHGRVELRNFGVFEVKQRKPRKARNPRTGQRVDVPRKAVITFKPGKEMEQRLRELEHVASGAPTSGPPQGESPPASTAEPTHTHSAQLSEPPAA
jgi:nucleoid DNA-binding protein